MIPRGHRRRTVLPARLRHGAGWSDACILNISTHGLMIYSKTPLKPGEHVDIRRGPQLVIARVVWRNNQRIGLCSRDKLNIEEIINSETAAAVVQATSGDVRIERRSNPREERSRHHSRAIQFVSLVLIGTTLAGAVAMMVAEALAAPAGAIEAALAHREPS